MPLPVINDPRLDADGTAFVGYIGSTNVRSTTRIFVRLRSDGSSNWSVFVGGDIVATDYDMRGAYGFVN